MIEILHGAAYSLVALVLLSWGGNLACRWLLRLTGLKPVAADAPATPEGAFAKRVGGLILRGAPLLMKGLGIAGTVAMFLVGGGIITHGIPPLYAAIQGLSEGLGAFGWALPLILDLAAGLLVGGALVGLLSIYRRLRGQTETS